MYEEQTDSKYRIQETDRLHTRTGRNWRIPRLTIDQSTTPKKN